MLRKLAKRVLTLPRKAIGKCKKLIGRTRGVIARKVERIKIKFHIYKTVEISVDDMLVKQNNHF